MKDGVYIKRRGDENRPCSGTDYENDYGILYSRTLNSSENPLKNQVYQIPETSNIKLKYVRP